MAEKFLGSFPFVPPPSLVGAYYLQPPDARAIFLHNDLLCNDTCSVTGGSITYWGGGGHKRKRSDFYPENCTSKFLNETQETLVIETKSLRYKEKKIYHWRKIVERKSPLFNSIQRQFKRVVEKTKEDTSVKSFCTRKMKFCLPSHRSSIDKNLKYLEFNEFFCG